MERAFSRRGRVARRLLILAAGMSHLALAPGCILPTPLESQKPQTEFPPPVILVDETTPAIGRLTLSNGDAVQIQVVAEDTQVPALAALQARLYVQIPTSPVLTPSAVSAFELPRVTDTSPFRFSGGPLSSTKFCLSENSGTLVFLFVGTDKLVDDPTQIMVPHDQQHWELICTQ